MEDISTSYTFWVALIGCITGCLGLIVSLFNLYRQRFRFKVEQINPACLYFKRIISKFDTTNQAIVNFTIINKSTYPLTVHRISALYKKQTFNYIFSPITSMPFTEVTFTTKSEPIEQTEDKTVLGNLYEVIDLKYQIDFPIRLDVFDAIECTYFVKWLHSKKPKYLLLRFSTTRGNRYKIIKLQELQYKYCNTNDQEDYHHFKYK